MFVPFFIIDCAWQHLCLLADLFNGLPNP